MVYLPPPHLASETRPSYGEAYAKILATHRRSPATSASSVIILVSPDVDALCAAQMLAELFKQDDVMYRIVPISSHTEFENMKDELATYADVRNVPLSSSVAGKTSLTRWPHSCTPSSSSTSAPSSNCPLRIGSATSTPV